MPTKEEVEAAENAFEKWRRMSGRIKSEDRFPFHAGFAAGVLIMEQRLRDQANEQPTCNCRVCIDARRVSRERGA